MSFLKRIVNIVVQYIRTSAVDWNAVYLYKYIRIDNSRFGGRTSGSGQLLAANNLRGRKRFK